MKDKTISKVALLVSVGGLPIAVLLQVMVAGFVSWMLPTFRDSLMAQGKEIGWALTLSLNPAFWWGWVLVPMMGTALGLWPRLRVEYRIGLAIAVFQFWLVGMLLAFVVLWIGVTFGMGPGA